MSESKTLEELIVKVTEAAPQIDGMVERILKVCNTVKSATCMSLSSEYVRVNC